MDQQIMFEGLWMSYGERMLDVPTDMTLSMRVTYPDGTNASITAPLTSDEIDAVNKLLTRFGKRIVTSL
jgi:hypothetical protein